MKTKTLLLICLFLGIGLTQISGQNGQKDAPKTYSEWYTTAYPDPVFCDGEQVDVLDLTITSHHIAKYVKGEWLHCFVQSTGTAVSVGFIDENGNKIGGTGEVFTIKEIAKQDNNIITATYWEWVANLHFNAKGNNGTHYIVSCTLYYDGRVEGGKSVCLGN
jgi:hypothetical protein